MENPEEILHSLEEFSKMKPKDIPRELEDYLCYVAKTGNPVYQWQTIKSLLREKLLNVITEFYESCPAVDIPPCPNVEIFNYDLMKNFILEKLDTFSAAPFTVQRICELLTTPRKEYNRIDKYMRALEKNILVVSTTEPNLGRRSTENGEGIMNGLESDHLLESGDSSHDINVEEMDESPARPRASIVTEAVLESENQRKPEEEQVSVIQENFENEAEEKSDVSSTESISQPDELSRDPLAIGPDEENTEARYVSIETVAIDTCTSNENTEHTENDAQPDISVTIIPMPSSVQEKTSDGNNLEETNDNRQPEEDTAKSEELHLKQETEETAEEESINEEISTSVASPKDTASEILPETTPLVADLGEVSSESSDPIDTTSTTSSSTVTAPVHSEAPRVQRSTDSETPEPETSENIVTFSKDRDDWKNEVTNEIESSDEKVDTEDMERATAIVSEPDLGNMADSSTSQEEVSESQSLEKLESVKDFSEPEETNSIDEPVQEPEPASEGVPMEVDMIAEAECKAKTANDEPTSTSSDINL